MKKFIFLLLVAMFPLIGNSQSAQRFYTALFPNPEGENYVAVIPNAAVYVCEYNVDVQCENPVGIYSDKQLNTPITQPLLADGSGVYSYYIQSGTQVVEKVCAPYNQCSSYIVQVGDNVNGGAGTVTSVACGNLDPLFGCTVTNPTTDPTLSFVLDPAQSLGVWMNPQATTAVPQYTTLVAGTNITFTPNTGVSPPTLTISATGGGSGCSISGLSETWVLSVNPVGNCYGDNTFSWDTNLFHLIIGDGTDPITGNNVTESYSIGYADKVSGSPTGADKMLFLFGDQNSITDTAPGTARNLQDIVLIGNSNTVTASTGDGAGIGDGYAFGAFNSFNTTTNGMSVVTMIGGGNIMEDSVAHIDDSEIVGNDNYMNGAISTAQIFGHLNQAVNVSYDNPLDVNQTIFGSQNYATHTGGGTYADYFDIFGHGNYEHDCYDCIAIGAGVEMSSNNTMGVGESRVPELRFTNSNVQRTPLTMSLPAPINTAIGLNQLPANVAGTCTVTFTGGTGSGGLGQVYTGGYIGQLNHYYIQITNPGSYSVAPTGATLSGGTNCTGSISVQATLLVVQACSTSLEGSFAAITDSTTNTWGATITGGGTDHVLGYCDGTNWTVAAK